MGRPNIIEGMNTRGLVRANASPHYKKLRRSFIKEDAKIRKQKLEIKRREYANRPFAF